MWWAEWLGWTGCMVRNLLRVDFISFNHSLNFVFNLALTFWVRRSSGGGKNDVFFFFQVILLQAAVVVALTQNSLDAHTNVENIIKCVFYFIWHTICMHTYKMVFFLILANHWGFIADKLLMSTLFQIKIKKNKKKIF